MGNRVCHRGIGFERIVGNQVRVGLDHGLRRVIQNRGRKHNLLSVVFQYGRRANVSPRVRQNVYVPVLPRGLLNRMPDCAGTCRCTRIGRTF